MEFQDGDLKGRKSVVTRTSNFKHRNSLEAKRKLSEDKKPENMTAIKECQQANSASKRKGVERSQERTALGGQTRSASKTARKSVPGDDEDELDIGQSKVKYRTPNTTPLTNAYQRGRKGGPRPSLEMGGAKEGGEKFKEEMKNVKRRARLKVCNDDCDSSSRTPKRQASAKRPTTPGLYKRNAKGETLLHVATIKVKESFCSHFIMQGWDSSAEKLNCSFFFLFLSSTLSSFSLPLSPFHIPLSLNEHKQVHPKPSLYVQSIFYV